MFNMMCHRAVDRIGMSNAATTNLTTMITAFLNLIHFLMSRVFVISLSNEIQYNKTIKSMGDLHWDVLLKWNIIKIQITLEKQ